MRKKMLRGKQKDVYEIGDTVEVTDKFGQGTYTVVGIENP